MPKHNYFVDMLRFFAAWMVVVYHLNQAIPHLNNWYRNLIQYGWLGVPVFFVISGYCIAISAHHSTGSGDFLSRRFLRIFPPYWVSIVIVLLAACFQKIFTGSNSVQEIPRSVPGILAAITLTTYPLTPIKTVNWVYWTLTCELFFYLSVGLVLLFQKKYLLIGLIAISLITCLLPYQKNGLLFFLDSWPPFGLGISIYYFFERSDKIATLGYGILFALNLFGLVNKFGHQPDYILVTVVSVILITLSHVIPIPKNLWSVLGQHSYSVYLIHVPIGVFILSLFEPLFVQQKPWLNLLYDGIAYAVIHLIAWGIFTWIEKPAIAYGREMSKRYFIKNTI
jgi:peptidoglycan/LPS O-acetylase OafA/YrhL